jgi:DNA topoisomerase-1
VLEALKHRKALKGKNVERVTFNAITKEAVKAAMAAPRDIDMELVDAYLARRALDYLVGFTLSPVLWRKLPGAKSAGRVQSVALRLVTEREMEIERFVPQEYWSVEANLETQRGENVLARLSAFEGKKLKRLDIADRETAMAALDAVKKGQFKVSAVESKPIKRNPPPPFTTSTMQQEAARKLGFSATRTMQAAQRLYEGVDVGGETAGLITYMRTDGVSMDESAYRDLRRVIGEDFGDRYAPDQPRRYTTKAKNAQEAHEAIRPTDASRRPDRLRLHGDLGRLYELIWKRAIASQMEAASIERTTVDFTEKTGRAELRATGQVILFDGFLKLYQEGRDDEDDNDENRRLPQMRENDPVKVKDAKADQHFTEPPPRFSEASLVKKLEELGIGRPSTYATILEKLRERNYVTMDKNRFVPDDRGRIVTAFLENFFRRYVEYDFTAGLEERLDQVSAGELAWKEFLRDFWKDFRSAVDEIGDLRIGEVLEALDEALGPHIFPKREDGGDPRVCPQCGEGKLSLRLGKFGAFVGCSNYPDCKYTRQLAPTENGNGTAPSEDVLGVDPKSGEEVTLRTGRFGPYVQLGNGDKPKRAGLPKGWSPEALTLEKALALLALPREVGPHPADAEIVLAGIGRYGPYIQKGKTYVSLPSVEDVFEIQMNRAVALLEDKQSGGGRFRRGAAAQPIKELGESPVTSKAIRVMPGRYGPYVTDGKTNATLPKDMQPEEVTLDAALALLTAKAEGGGRANGGGRGTALKELGESPDTGKPVRVMPGRYGPYVTDGAVNASLPKSTAPEDMTLDFALTLLAAKGDGGGGKRASAAKTKTPAKKSAKAAEKSTPKKPAAKKAAAKKKAK